MADKPLNQVTKVTDLSKVKTFLAVMDDNTIQQMSKEDMATVVGGLIGTATPSKDGLMPKDGFYNRGRLSDRVDLNDYTVSGIYSITATTSTYNFPTNWNGWGTLEVVQSEKDGSFCVQILHDYSRTYRRMKGGSGVGGEWSSWKEL